MIGLDRTLKVQYMMALLNNWYSIKFKTSLRRNEIIGSISSLRNVKFYPDFQVVGLTAIYNICIFSLHLPVYPRRCSIARVDLELMFLLP